MKEKAFIVLVCIVGLAAVFYGMIEKNHAVFVIGLVFLIGGYLGIRKKLKASMREKKEDRS